MKRKKISMYDTQETQILEKSTAFVQFLTRKGVLEDQNIDDEKVRKAKKSTVWKAYHNTEVLLEQYRTIIWVLDCVPGDLAAELHVPTQNIDALVARIDFEMAMENKKLESRLNVTMKTRVLLDRLYDALGVLRKMPGNGEQLYNLIYATYLDPVQRKHADLIDMLHVSSRTYYRLRTEAISIMSIRLWSAPSGDIDDWLEILTLMENI